MNFKLLNIFSIRVFAILISTLYMVYHSCSGDKGFDIEVFNENFQKNVETLSSDKFEGRAPSTEGAKLTEAFIEDEFIRIGLKPANGKSYRQAVPLVEITGSNFSELVLRDDSKDTFSFKYKDEMVVGTTRLDIDIRLDKSDLVFAGFGIVAPEYSWDDYKEIDVKGKTVIVFVNDPGYHTEDTSLFTGKTMTYYGRWTYKYEEAARQGAAGIFIVHETGPAGYGWDVVRNSWSGPQYELAGDENSVKVEVQGWLHQDAAGRIFEKSGLTLQQAKEMAVSKDFKAIELGQTASVNFNVEFTHFQSYNIAAYVEGSKYPEETIIYMAHWDHLGKEETPEGVKIYNGAVDNATGTAAIIAIAEKFARLKTSPERSVVFMAVTAEESGLLGSRYYSENPLFPVETTVGGINIDGLNVYGPTHDVSVVGYNSSELQDYLSRHASEQDRILIPEKYPERGYFYRSDHFNMLRKGVPMIYANSGQDFIGRDEEYALMAKKDQEGRYHSHNDTIHDLWNWDGLHQNLWLFFNVGQELANSRDWPKWNNGSEFKGIRETSDSLRRPD